jgi:hypothetical protein
MWGGISLWDINAGGPVCKVVAAVDPGELLPKLKRPSFNVLIPVWMANFTKPNERTDTIDSPVVGVVKRVRHVPSLSSSLNFKNMPNIFRLGQGIKLIAISTVCVSIDWHVSFLLKVR